MNASEAKHQVKLAEWSARVAECRSSGKSVRTWCAEQGVGYKTYYRWEREILQIASKGLALAPHQEDAAPVFAELPAPVKKQEPTLMVSVHIGSASLDVYSGADAEIVTTLCRALSHAE